MCQHFGGLLDLVFLLDPHRPSIARILFDIILHALHVEIIPERARACFLRKMADQPHINLKVANERPPEKEFPQTHSGTPARLPLKALGGGVYESLKGI
jgi:hypothetical protein